jgi:hypothetical protein
MSNSCASRREMEVTTKPRLGRICRQFDCFICSSFHALETLSCVCCSVRGSKQKVSLQRSEISATSGARSESVYTCKPADGVFQYAKSSAHFILSLWFYSPSNLGRFFSFLILYTVGRTPWTVDQLVATAATHTQNNTTTE